ncbi:hypothetical protein HKD37_15G043732 [Glycine soja]|nr:hypothetical protein GmHk_15G044715 [Glycine max]
MAKLAAAQLHFAATVASMESKLDALLLKLPPITSHHYPSSSSIQSPPLPPLLRMTAPPCPVPIQQCQSPMPTLPPMPLSLSMSSLSSMSIAPPCSTPMQPSLVPSPTPLPMPTAPPCPALVQPFLPPLSALLPMPALHLPNLDPVCTAISFNKLINTIFLYDHAVVPHDKPWKYKDMVMFEMGHMSYRTAMAAYKLQLVAFALCTTAKPGAIRRNRPWDLGITFESHALKP